MTRPRFLLDCDGVLADWLTPALWLIRSWTGKSYRTEDFDDWQIAKRLTDDGLDGFNLVERAVREVPLDNLAVLPGAVAAVGALKHLGDVYVVTAAPDVQARAGWLERHFGLHRRRLVHAWEKSLIGGDLFVDDRPDHVAQWGNVHGHERALLFAQPYNFLITTHRRVGWDGVLRVAEEVACSR